MSELLLGVDGGGSKTRALLADRSGTVLGIGGAGTSNYQSVGFERATRALGDAISHALRDAGLESGTLVDAACFGLAGAGRPADRTLFEAWLAGQEIARRWIVASDYELVLADGTPEQWGIALICGTGSICYGRTATGQEARAGGWGYLLGDEGSGYDIAKEALRLATQTADGRAHAHAILAAILDHWQLQEPRQLIPYVYRPEMTPADIASLARVVLGLADGGDEAARGLVEHAAGELARLVAAVVRALQLQAPPVALAGGLLGASDRLRHSIRAHLEVPVEPMAYVDDPARGALRIASRLLQPM